MAKPMPMDQPELNGQALRPVQTGIVEEFARILNHLSEDKGCQRITRLVSEMDDLRAKNEELEREMEKSNIAETSNLAAIQKVMNDKQVVDQRCSQKDADLKVSQVQASEAKKSLRLAEEEVVALKNELQSTTEGFQKAMSSGKKQEVRISNLNDIIAKLQESAKQAEKDKQAARVERAQANERYDAVSQELQALKQRAFPLQPASDSALNEHKRQLRGLFDDVFRLVYRFFGQLHLESLEPVEGKWQKFTQHHALAAIPLPRSNSESAIHMRVAAVLRLIFNLACAYIFQPVYLTLDGMEVAAIIDQLESLEAEWVRSVLLNINRKKQGVYGMKRADIACGKIVDLVGFLVTSAADTQDLENELRQWCQKATKLWMTLQVLEARIEAELEVQFNVPSLVGWRPFPSPSPKDKNSTAGAQNGIKSKPEEKAQLVMKNIAAEVCPRFLATTADEHSDLLMPGFVLLNAQIETASQELKAQAASPDQGGGSHRSAQGRQRQELWGEINGLATGGATGLWGAYRAG